MKKSIFISVVIGFALLGGSIAYLLHRNAVLEAENEHLKGQPNNVKNVATANDIDRY